MYRPVAALSLMALPGLAMADITAEDVWANMQTAYAAIGLTASGTTTRSGNTLTISDARVTMTYPEIGGQAVVTLPQMGLVEQGDGTVRILTPDTYLVEVEADIPQETEPLRFELAIAQSGVDSIVSGTPGDLTYTTETADFDMIVNGLQLPGTDQTDFVMELDSDGYSSVTRITEGDAVRIDWDSTNRATRTSLTMRGDGMTQESHSEGGDMMTRLSLVLPPEMNIMNLTPALMSGLSVSIDSRAEASSSASSTTMNGALMSEQVQNIGPSSAKLSIDRNGLSVSGTVDGFDTSFTMPDMVPFPIEIGGSAASARFASPLLSSPAPQGFDFGLDLTGIEIPEALWSMIDPAATLDHSPIDLTVDVSGLLDWTLDAPDLASMAAMDATGEAPVKIRSANLDALGLSALGGSVTVDGAFTFDNADLETFDGFPRPEGTAVARATGLNAVLDQLVAAGLVPEDQVSMGRMFIGMFARSVGDDALETTIEVNDLGHVMVNGQRMR